MMGKAPVTLRDIAESLGGELVGRDDIPIDGIGTLETAGPTQITFLASPRYRDRLGASLAACVIVAPTLRVEAAARGAAIVSDDPYLYFARLTQWWVARTRPSPLPGVHPSAQVDRLARVHDSASIGALAVVEADAEIGAGAVVGAQCFVGRGARIGDGTLLHPRVVLSFGCAIGARGVVHSGAVIGSDGFGFAPTRAGYVKIEQLGAVRIGDDVEIGANTCIDRGAIEDTVIDDGVKLDNLIQIAHNVHLGRGTAMAAQVGIAGSTRIGQRCTFAGQSGAAGHLTLGDDVHIGAQGAVLRSIAKPGLYSGYFPLDENRAFEKNAATLRQLHALRDRLRALERKAGGSQDDSN